MLQSRKDSLREGNASIPQFRKESLKDNSGNVCPLVDTSPPKRKDSDRLPSLPPQRDEGYEAVQMPQRPSKPKPAPATPPEYVAPPVRPQKPSGSTNTAATASPYQMVEIIPPKDEGQEPSAGWVEGSGDPLSSHRPPRPPKPGSFSGSQPDDSSNIYQQPRAASRDDIYDNVKIKNLPLASKDGQTSSLETNVSGIIKNDVDSSLSHEEFKKVEEATDGKLEIDSGGMGCQNIEKAMEERRQVLKETETKEGVVLLSVQKLRENSSDRLETYGMCLLFRNTYTSMRTTFLCYS